MSAQADEFDTVNFFGETPPQRSVASNVSYSEHKVQDEQQLDSLQHIQTDKSQQRDNNDDKTTSLSSNEVSVPQVNIPQSMNSQTSSVHSDVNWVVLNSQLQRCGFGGIFKSGDIRFDPEYEALYTALQQVLNQYQLKQQTIDELATATSGTGDKIDKQQQQIKDLQKQLNSVKREYDEQRRSQSLVRESLQLEKGKTSESARKMKDEIGNLSKQVSNLKRTLSSKNQEIQSLRESASHSDREALLAKAKASGAKRTSESLESDIQKLKTGNRRLENKCKENERTINEMKEVIRMSQKNEIDAIDKCNVAMEEKRASDERIIQLQQRLKSASSLQNQWEDKNDQLEQELHAVRVESRQMKAKLQEAQDQNRKMEAEVNSLQSQIKQLQSITKNKEREFKQQAEEHAQLHQQLLQAQQTVKQLQDNKRHLEQQLLVAKQDSAHSNLHNKNQDKQLQKLEQSKLQLKSFADKLQESKSELEERVRDMEKEIIHLSNEVKSVAQSRESKEYEALNYRKVASELSLEVDTLKRQSGQDSAHIEKMQKELVQNRNQVRVLQNQTQSQQQEIEELRQISRNQSSLGNSARESTQSHSDKKEAERVENSGCHPSVVNHLRHVVQQQENTIQQLKDKLHDNIIQEERKLERNKEAYEQLKRAFALNKSKLKSNNAQFLATSVRELRPIEIVGMYEDQRVHLEEQLAGSQAEVKQLCQELKNAQNSLAMHAYGLEQAQQEAGFTQQLQEQVLELQSQLDKCRHDLKLSENKCLDSIRKGARELAEAERRSEELAEENASLILELNARPTVKQKQSMQRQIDLLERRLSKVRTQEQQVCETIQEDDRQKRSSLENIRRDKEVHRLGLHVIEDWSKGVLVEIIQDVGVCLQLNDITQLRFSVEKLLRIADTVPELESFQDTICECVYRKGQAFLPSDLVSHESSQISFVLQYWIRQLQQHNLYQDLLDKCYAELSKRVHLDQSSGKIEPCYLPEVIKELVQFETNSAHVSELVDAANGLTYDQPEEFLSRVVQHLLELFECKGLEGLIPRANQIYLGFMEGKNFIRSLACILGLVEDQSVNACIKRVRQLVDKSGKELSFKEDYMKKLEGLAYDKWKEDNKENIEEDVTVL